ncbi:hypothetical protein DFJ74DRAFT_305637 [Hyaloraphidium curvatum]|nr:hypothetical protein DFJ74DRAFT_305637 [Hyaloraphidium curvatum]
MAPNQSKRARTDSNAAPPPALASAARGRELMAALVAAAPLETRVTSIRGDRNFVPAPRSEDEETALRWAGRLPTGGRLHSRQFAYQLGDDGTRHPPESSITPDAIGMLASALNRRGLMLGDSSEDEGGKHRRWLWKSLSTFLFHNEARWKELLEATVCHIQAHRKDYEVPIAKSWARNVPAARSGAGLDAYLGDLLEARVDPFFPVLHAVAECLDVELNVWTWTKTTAEERVLFTFTARDTTPRRRLYLVRQRPSLSDQADYRPIFPASVSPPESTASLNLVPEPDMEQEIKLPGMGPQPVRLLLNEWFTVGDGADGQFMQLTREGAVYRVRKYKGRRLEQQIMDDRFPQDFPVRMVMVPSVAAPPDRVAVDVLPEDSGAGQHQVVADVPMLPVARACDQRDLSHLALFQWPLATLRDFISRTFAAKSSSQRGPAADLVAHLLSENLTRKEAALHSLEADLESAAGEYVRHVVPVLFVGETKVGKSTTINTIARADLVSESDWQAYLAEHPYEDSGVGEPYDERDPRYVDYNGREVDILPSSTQSTTTRFAQTIVASDGEVGFTVECWTLEEVDAQLELVRSLFETVARDRDQPAAGDGGEGDDEEDEDEDDEDDEEKEPLPDAIKNAFLTSKDIWISAPELCSMLDIGSENELFELEPDRLVLPEAKRVSLESMPATKTLLFRKPTLDQSLEALRNEYLRATVNPLELHGLLKKATVRLPFRHPFSFIDVPGLQKEDPYGYQIAVDALKGKHGSFDTLVMIFRESLPAADVTNAVQDARLGTRILETGLELVAFTPIDKSNDLGTLEAQQAKGGVRIAKYVSEKPAANVAYLMDKLVKDRWSGVAAKALKLGEQENKRRFDVVKSRIHALAANVLLRNPEQPSVEDLVKLILDGTSARWRNNAENLQRQLLVEMSSVARLLHNFASFDSPDMLETVLFHTKDLAQRWGRPNVEKSFRDFIEMNMNLIWDSAEVKKVVDPIVNLCSATRMMENDYKDLRDKYLKRNSKVLNSDLRNLPIPSRGMNNATDFTIRPLRNLLVPQLIDVILRRFSSVMKSFFATKEDGPPSQSASRGSGSRSERLGAASILEIIDGNFDDLELDDADHEQKQLAKKILQDERNRLIGALRKASDKVLANARVEALALLDETFKDEVNEVLGGVFLSTRLAKKQAGKTINETRMDYLVHNANPAAATVAKAVVDAAQKLVKAASGRMTDALLRELRVFTARFSSMRQEDVKRYLEQGSLNALRAKAVDACSVLIGLWDSYVTSFISGQVGDDDLPILLEGADTVEEQAELLNRYREYAAGPE